MITSKEYWNDWEPVDDRLECRAPNTNFSTRKQYRLKNGKTIAEISTYIHEGDAYISLTDWNDRGSESEKAELLDRLNKIFEDSANFSV